MNLNFLLVVFFIIIGVAGFIFKVDAGVFIGFSLFPFQLSKMKKGKSFNNIFIVIGTLLGSVYFIWTTNWLLLVLFLFSQTLTYSASLHLMKDENQNKKGDI